MPNTFLPPPGSPGGVAPVIVSPTGGGPTAMQPGPLGGFAGGVKGQMDGLTQALMLAKLRQGKLGVPAIPGQVPGATTQPGVVPYQSTPGLPDQ